MEIDPRYLAPLATSIGIMVTVYLYLLQRKKELTYEVLWRQQLVELKGKNRNRLALHFDGKPALDATLIVLRLTNSGHVSIQPNEYQVRLSLDCGSGSEILMAEVAETEPHGLNEDSTAGPIIEKIVGHRIILRPMLLNRHDSVTLQILVTQPAEKIVLSGHVQGVRKLRAHIGRARWPAVMMHTGQVITWTAMLCVPTDKLFSMAMVELMPFIFSFLTGQVLFFGGLHFERQSAKAAQWSPFATALE